VVAGLVALLEPAVVAELVDLQHLVEEAGLAGSAMAVENWTHPSPRCLLERVFC
jgi:hypothetical protein